MSFSWTYKNINFYVLSKSKISKYNNIRYCRGIISSLYCLFIYESIKIEHYISLCPSYRILILINNFFRRVYQEFVMFDLLILISTEDIWLSLKHVFMTGSEPYWSFQIYVWEQYFSLGIWDVSVLFLLKVNYELEEKYFEQCTYTIYCRYPARIVGHIHQN